MKRILCVLLIIVLALSFAGCGQMSADDGVLSIVVTAFPHYDFARQITKDIENVEIKMLISPGSEVHSYEPSPSDMLAVSSCDVFIYTGGESDTWAKGILESAGNKDMTVISFMDLCADSIEEHEKEHEGHEHEYDEHVWTSPTYSVYLAHSIKNILVGIDKKNAEKYIKNGEEFEMAVRQIEVELCEVLNDSVRDEIIVADRFPFYHFAEEFDIKYSSAYSGCSHATEPSASFIASLSKKVKEEKIPCVFTIEFSNGKIAKSVTEGVECEVLTLHSCHNVSKEEFENGVTYCDLMMKNVRNLRKALCE